MNDGKKYDVQKNGESGVALVTVIMISVLLLIACIAILSAVGAHSRNVTDVLSETKAYYAAESGIQSTINVLRNNTTIDYTKAVTPATSNYSGDPAPVARLSQWMTYNYTPTGASAPDRIVIGPGTYTPNTGTAYKVEVSDPDNTAVYTTFSTTGTFLSNSLGTISIPNSTDANRTVITFTNVTNSSVIFATNTTNPMLAGFQVTNYGTGASTISDERFRIDYTMSAPRAGTRSVRGYIRKTNGSSISVIFDSQKYALAGSEVQLCSASTSTYPCSSVTLTLTPNTTTSLYAHLTPVEPYRLKLLATGFGPNGARKQLEAIIQRNFFNELSAAAAVSALGPYAGSTFNPGTSAAITYQGSDSGGTGVTIPAIGFTDPLSVTALQNAHVNGTISPPPALLGGEIPDWQQSPTAMNDVITRLRTTSQNSLRYYDTGVQPPDFGNFTNGTGITFCDGNCSLHGNGGGILVVTGSLTLSGAFSFKGLIIVTGSGGIQRNGGGNGQIIGNVVIAPYNPGNLAAGFLPPQYDMNGGGNSDVIYNAASVDFDGQVAISDFMQGVSEK